MKNSKLKIIPGRTVSGRDIRKRLNNRSLQGSTYGDESYTTNEEMVKFSRMSRPEQVMAAKQNAELIRETQKRLEASEKRRHANEEKKRFDEAVAKRAEELSKSNQSNE